MCLCTVTEWSMTSPAMFPGGSMDGRVKEPRLLFHVSNTWIQMFSILPSPILPVLGLVFHSLYMWANNFAADSLDNIKVCPAFWKMRKFFFEMAGEWEMGSKEERAQSIWQFYGSEIQICTKKIFWTNTEKLILFHSVSQCCWNLNYSSLTGSFSLCLSKEWWCSCTSWNSPKLK